MSKTPQFLGPIVRSTVSMIAFSVPRINEIVTV